MWGKHFYRMNCLPGHQSLSTAQPGRSEEPPVTVPCLCSFSLAASMSADKIPSTICCISSGHRRGSLRRIEEHAHGFSSSPIAFGPLPTHTTQLWCFLKGFKLGWEVLGESPNLQGVCFVPFTLPRAQFTLRLFPSGFSCHFWPLAPVFQLEGTFQNGLVLIPFLLKPSYLFLSSRSSL